MYFELADPDPSDNNAYVDLVSAAANRKPFDICRFRNISPIDDPLSYFKTEIKERIFTYGITRFLKQPCLNEAVIKKNEAENVVLQILHEYLQHIPVDDELIIIDPYLYKANSINYASYFGSVLGPFASGLRRLYTITDSHNDQAQTVTTIQAEIRSLNPGITIHHTTSADFHDRFWISNARGSGVLLGSSLNSLGRKYAIIDRLKDADVRDIVAALTTRGLV